MGKIRDWLKGPSFAVDEESVPAEVFGLTSYVNPTAYSPKIDRRSAMQVPAVKRTHDLIPGTLGGLPLNNYDASKRLVPNPLFEQPEKNVPRSVSFTRTAADLMFDEIAWWRIIESDLRGFPLKAKRLKSGTVTVDEDQGVVYVDGKIVPDSELIRFDSPTQGLLIAGARAIRTCLLLDAAAAKHVDGTPPLDYFTPEGNVDPFADKAEAKQFLDDWNDSRRENTTGYVPFTLKYNAADWDAKKLQLAEARQHAVLEIARVGGVDPEELGVSTTSRTYQNEFDRRKNFTDLTLGLYMHAIEDRLSMGDVTPRGQYAKFDLDAFMRSDPKTRMETYEIGKRVGAYTEDEIRHLEDKEPLTADQKPQPALRLVPPVEEESGVAADQLPEHTFDGDPEIRLDMPTEGLSFAVDYELRQISGCIVPYGVVGISNGQRWVFSQGTLKFADPKRVKLWIQHDKNRTVGFGLSFDDRPDGMYAVFQVEKSPEGDEALRKADPDGSATWDAFSIGLRPGGKYRKKGGINFAIEAPLMETSLTPAPSFDDARVHQVAADSTNPERHVMPCTKCGQNHAAGVVECNAADVAAFEAEQNGPTFDAAVITDAIAAGFASIADGTRETVSATEGLEINEEPVYRFDGIAGQFSLIEDMRAGTQGDVDARQRVDEFFNDAATMFAVSSANVATLNPVQNRPELYVPNLTYTSPLWDMVTTGALTDKTPFTIPKFASASGLVGAHTEGVEPTPGAFTATSQTVTPTAISGKIEVVREVLDQGGSPQADQIIWGEIVNAYYEAREARVAAVLNAIAGETNLASAVDSALVDAITGILVGLQFVRGGNRFTGLALDGKLFPALVNAKDTTNRKLLPIYGPMNAQGEASGAFDRVSIGNLTGRAAWALGAGNDAKSYLFVPSSVYAWASAPKRFNFEYQLKSVDIGVWGYGAAAVTRDSDVKPIDYTTADV